MTEVKITVNKKNSPSPEQLLRLARGANTLREFEKYEYMLFHAMTLFAQEKDENGEEKYSFYPTYAYALMKDCLAGKGKFAVTFNYKKFFAALLESNNKCNIGQVIYLFRYLSLGNTLSQQKLTAEENKSFSFRKNQFFYAFDACAFLDKCDELQLVGTACDNEDYEFLYNYAYSQEK